MSCSFAGIQGVQPSATHGLSVSGLLHLSPFCESAQAATIALLLLLMMQLLCAAQAHVTLLQVDRLIACEALV